MKRGDKVTVTDGNGKPIEAIYVCLSYRKNPKHHQVRVMKEWGTKGKLKPVDWFLPESRFVSPV